MAILPTLYINNRKAYALIFYITKMLLLALLFGFLGIWVFAGSASTIMNQVSLQRSRGVRIAKDALILRYDPLAIDRTQALSEMQDTLPVWARTETALVTGDSTLQLPHPPSEVVTLVAQAQSDYLPMQIAAQHLLVDPTHIDPTQVQIILDHEHGYAVSANQITLAWQQHIDDAFYRLFWIEASLVIVVAAVITLNFFVIMRRGNS